MLLFSETRRFGGIQFFSSFLLVLHENNSWTGGVGGGEINAI